MSPAPAPGSRCTKASAARAPSAASSRVYCFSGGQAIPPVQNRPTRRIACRPPLRRLRLEHVSRAANGVNELRRREFFDVTAEAIDVRLDQIREWIEFLSPHVIGNLFARDDAPGIAREILEHRV